MTHSQIVKMLASFLIAVGTCPLVAQSIRPTKAEENTLNSFLAAYLGTPDKPHHDSAQYIAAFVDLRDNGKREAIVYITDHNWCGTGGCSLLILAPSKSTYRVITRTTVTRPPIRVLHTKTNGWHDLAVSVRGELDHPDYEVKLAFNSRTYPKNPSGPPAKRLATKVPGRILIAAPTY